MTNIYFYKMTVDNNGAPCAHSGKLTLAICNSILMLKGITRIMRKE